MFEKSESLAIIHMLEVVYHKRIFFI